LLTPDKDAATVGANNLYIIWVYCYIELIHSCTRQLLTLPCTVFIIASQRLRLTAVVATKIGKPEKSCIYSLTD